MSAIHVTIDEVPVTTTDRGLVVTTDDDPNQNGLVEFTVEVEYDDDGEWWITQVYRDKNCRQPIVGRYGIEIARILEGYGEKVIEDKLAGQDVYPSSNREPYHEAGRTL
jgi:hypothetical protein